MKKICFITILLMICVSFAFTQVKYEGGLTSYVNVPILKIYDHPNYYIVTYRQNGLGIGQTSIPKEWFKQGSPEKKGLFRNIKGDLNPYLTLWFHNGEFDQIYINCSMNRSDDVWGVAYGTQKAPEVIDPAKVAAGL
ncbi:MAG: hypothetical protein K5930_09385 [Treponemataceae bacterium]|nr:hypothetical protein [Treponemataceae bacterium]